LIGGGAGGAAVRSCAVCRASVGTLAIGSSSWGRALNSRSKGALYVGYVEELEVFPGDGVFVAFAQEAQIVGVFEILETGGILAEFLHVVLDCPRILDATVDQLFFAVALNLKLDFGQEDDG